MAWRLVNPLDLGFFERGRRGRSGGRRGRSEGGNERELGGGPGREATRERERGGSGVREW